MERKTTCMGGRKTRNFTTNAAGPEEMERNLSGLNYQLGATRNAAYGPGPGAGAEFRFRLCFPETGVHFLFGSGYCCRQPRPTGCAEK